VSFARAAAYIEVAKFRDTLRNWRTPTLTPGGAVKVITTFQSQADLMRAKRAIRSNFSKV
jgi:hypothetical protein